MRESCGRRDYSKEFWKRGERVIAILASVLAVGFLAWFFYRSVWAFFPLSIVGVWLYRSIAAASRERCRKELSMEFRECILSVSNSLRTGYAIENAFIESGEDLRLLYGENSMMYQEILQIRRGLVIHLTLEELLLDLAGRSDCEEIRQFATILSIAKRGGGNLVEIIQSTCELIGQKLDADRELTTVLSGRTFEQHIMEAMPFAIVGYIGLSNPGYFAPLYHNIKGVAVMTGCLAAYIAACVLGMRILGGMRKRIGL